MKTAMMATFALLFLCSCSAGSQNNQRAMNWDGINYETMAGTVQ